MSSSCICLLALSFWAAKSGCPGAVGFLSPSNFPALFSFVSNGVPLITNSTVPSSFSASPFSGGAAIRMLTAGSNLRSALTCSLSLFSLLSSMRYTPSFFAPRLSSAYCVEDVSVLGFAKGASLLLLMK